MNEVEDSVTRIAHRALDLLFMKHPVRTSLGVVLGLVFALLSEVFSPLLAKAHFLDLSHISRFEWIPLGILVAHLPTLAHIYRRSSSNESVDDVLRLLKEAPFSKAERRQKYRELINIVAKNVAMSPEAFREVTKVRKAMDAETQNTD